MRTIVWTLSAVLTAQISWAQGTPTFEFSGTAVGDRFGAAVGGAGDVDNDGFADTLVGAPQDGVAASSTAPPTGYAVLYSGRDGKPIYLFLGATKESAFGAAVAGIGDLNGDGFVDLLVGAPKDSTSTQKQVGSITAFSGANGGALYRTYGGEPAQFYGTSIANLGDTDADGIDDFVAGAPGSDTAGAEAGIAYVVDGKTGDPQVKILIDGLGPYRLGTAVASGGFMTTAGPVVDVLVGAPAPPDTMPASLSPGYAFAFTVGGKLFYKSQGQLALDGYGSAISGGVDLNQDGAPDLVIGAPFHKEPALDSGLVYVRSGKLPASSDNIIRTFAGAAGEQFGASVTTVPDVDGDQIHDLLIGAPGVGRVDLISMATGEVLNTWSGLKGLGTSVAFVGLVDGAPGDQVAIGASEAANADGNASGVAIVDGAAPFDPAIGLDSSAPVERSYEIGAVPPTAETRVVMNLSADALLWEASVPAGNDWLIVAPPSGNIASGGGQSVSISFNVTGLVENTYQANVTFRDAMNPADAVVIPVTLDVSIAATSPALCIEGPPSLLIQSDVGEPAQMIELGVGNCGNPAFNLGYIVEVESDAGWLAVDHSSGSVVAGGDAVPLMITVAPTIDVEAGLHQGLVRVRNVETTTDVIEIPVTLAMALSTFIPGDKLKGAITGVDDIDGAAFVGLAGMTLNLDLTIKNTPLDPYVAIVDDTGAELKRWQFKGKKNHHKRKYKLKQSGIFQLHVGGLKASEGAFTLKTTRKLPASAKTKQYKKVKPKDGLAELKVKVLPGAVATVIVTPSGVSPTSVFMTLVEPDGTAYDTSSFASYGSGTVQLSAVPLHEVGDWTLQISGLDVPKAKADVIIIVQQPSPGAATVDLQ